MRLFLFSAAAFAFSMSAQPSGGFGPPLDPLVRMLDANGDGEISAAELAKAEEALRRLDRNRDGRLAGEEIFPRPPGGPGGFGRPGGFGGPGPNRAEQKLTCRKLFFTV